MRNVRTSPSDRAELRRRAVERIKAGEAARGTSASEADLQKLIQELQIHQIELEMQNDELRTTQAGAEESRARYEDLYDFSPVGYFTFDRAGLIEALNLTGAKLLGKERGSLIKSPFSGFIDSKSLDVFLSHLDAVFENETKQSCELSLATEERSHVPVVIESIRIQEGHGEIGQCRSAVLDITERKRAEEALRNSENALREREELFRVTFDRSPIGAAMVGIDQRITRANNELCRMLGYTEEEIAGMTLRDITHPDDIETDLENVRMMLAGRSDSFSMEKRYIRKEGGIVWGRLSAGLVRDAEGRPLYFVGMIEDITGRVQAERYHNLAAEILGILNNPSTLDDSISLILAAMKRGTDFDAVGIRLRSGEDFPYFVQNGFFGDFLLAENSLTARDGSGDPCRNETGDISLECTCGLVISGQTDPANPFFTTGGSFWINDSQPLLDLPAAEDPRLHPRNTCIHQGYLSVALIPIRANRDIVGLLQFNDRRKDRFSLEMIRLFEGIAESIGIALIRKQTEGLLEKQSAKLENANKELESFSYSVSHDLRAPLRAIDGFSRVILKRKGDQFDEETKRQFQLIRDGAQTMNRLIDDILAFSRSGKQERVVLRIDMDELVRETWEELSAIHPDRRFDLRMDRLPSGMGDRALIKQALTNLLSNAIKYSATRDISIVEVSGRADEKETVYSVKDNGVGFDMVYYHKLFGVFQRLHSNAEFEGTGVGLAIVQRIIHRHGGRVWAEAEKEKGATFFFTLPIRQG